jgi:hypothetical protein
MKKEVSKNWRRLWVLMNYLSLVLLTGVFELREYFPEYAVIIVMVSSLVLLLISFYRIYWATGIWLLTHLPFNRMDEREVQVTGEATRIGYAIFAVTALILIYLSSLTEIKLSIVVAAGLIYFAHIMPTSVLAWKYGKR